MTNQRQFMRIDDRLRSERYFTSGLLLPLLLHDGGAGAVGLLRLLSERGALPLDVDWLDLTGERLEIVAELAIWRDLLKHNRPTESELATPKDVIDVVIVAGSLVVAIEGKFFTPTNKPAIAKQLASQGKALAALCAEQRFGVQQACQVLLTADEAITAEDRGLLGCDGVLHWRDMHMLAVETLGRESYVAQRLQSAIERYEEEFPEGVGGPNWTGIDNFQAIIDRSRREGDAIVVGFSGGATTLGQQPLEKLQQRAYKWDHASGGVGKKVAKNWLPGSVFLQLLEAKLALAVERATA